MLGTAIARGIEERCWCRAAEWPIVPNIDPGMTRDGFALCQDRHGRVIGVQPLGLKHVRFDQRLERP
jgi:hypothetical protein